MQKQIKQKIKTTTKKKWKENKKKHHRNKTRSPKFRMKHNVCTHRKKITTTTMYNKPAHSSHSLCAQHKAKVLKLDQIKLPIISLLHIQTSVWYVLLLLLLLFDQFQDRFAWITAWQMNFCNNVIASPMEFNWNETVKSNFQNHLNFDSCESISSSFLGCSLFCVKFFFVKFFCVLVSLVQDKTLLFTGVGWKIHDICKFFDHFFHFTSKEWKKKWLKRIVQGHSTISKIGLLWRCADPIKFE